MLAITCDKCRRRYSATDEELRVYLNEAEGKKYAQVLCSHCGKASKVAVDRIHQALRFSAPPPEPQAPAPDPGAATSEIPAAGGTSEEENPPA
jgi:hypothetical protein